MSLPLTTARLFLGLIVLLPIAALAAVGPAAPDAGVLVLGRVSDNPKEDYGKLKPLLDYVVPRLADVGITRGRVLMARDSQQMVSYLKRGKVDWITETAGAAMSYEERAGARLLLAVDRGGSPSYQSVFFARRDRGIRRLEDLLGRTIAFQNSASTSAYFLPASEVLAAGLPLVILASPSDRPSPDLAGFVFARSEANISAWVHKGLVDAGAFSDHDWRNLSRMPSAFRADLVVFHRTDFVPRAVDIVRAGLSPRVEERLKTVLLRAADDLAARDALNHYFETASFAEIDADLRQKLDKLRRGVARVRVEVE